MQEIVQYLFSGITTGAVYAVIAVGLSMLYSSTELINFAHALEQVCIDTVESGKMTKDLALIIHGSELKEEHYLTTEQFLEALDENLLKKLS